MIKKILYFILLLSFKWIFSIAYADIIPLKKPLQSKEEKEQKLLIDVLKPLPKPIKETVNKEIEKKTVVQKQKINGLILPKKKPLIAGTKKNLKLKYQNIIVKRILVWRKKLYQK